MDCQNTKYPQCNGVEMASVSKGCIAVKGSGKLKTSKEVWPPVKKLDLYKKLNIMIEETMEAVHEKVSSGIFDNILKFVQNSTEHCDIRFRSVRRIPTAVLITGANIPDHMCTFSRLVKEMKRKVSKFVAVLSAEECCNIKTIIQNMVTQITQQLDHNMDLKKVNCTMPVLQGCYKNYIETTKSPKRKSPSKTPTKLKPKSQIIVVIEDLEGADLNVIENFILICSEYASNIPFAFVIGIPTSMSSIQRLPQTVLDKLNIENFAVASPTDYLTEVVSQILLNPNIPFKVGPRVYKLMEYSFLCHDFSISNFIKTFKFCLMEHFSDCDSASILCCYEDDIKATVKKVSTASLNDIRKLGSFKSYVESRPLQERRALLLNDDEFLAVIPQLLQDVHDYHTYFVPTLHCLHALVHQLPKHPLGRQLRELYGYCLEDSISSTPDYKQAMKLIRLLSVEEFISKTRVAANAISDSITPLLSAMQTMKEQILKNITKLETHCQQISSESEDEPSTVLEVKKSRSDFQKMIKDLGDRKKPKAHSDYIEKRRNKIVEMFETLFREFLKSPNMMPLHEGFYYDDVANVKQHVIGNPRGAIQSALSNPSRYLECNCCNVSDPGSITSDMPDSVILYKLHLECARLINMRDWLESFITIKTESDDAELTKQLQIRFKHAVSELQFLGFVQSTRRKCDQLARLTWGGC